MKNKTERDPGYFLTLAGFDFARDFFILSRLTARVFGDDNLQVCSSYVKFLKKPRAKLNKGKR